MDEWRTSCCWAGSSRLARIDTAGFCTELLWSDGLQEGELRRGRLLQSDLRPLRSRPYRLALARPADREIHRLDQRRLHRRIREQSERVLGDRAVMARALDRVL